MIFQTTFAICRPVLQIVQEKLNSRTQDEVVGATILIKTISQIEDTPVQILDGLLDEGCGYGYIFL